MKRPRRRLQVVDIQACSPILNDVASGKPPVDFPMRRSEPMMDPMVHTMLNQSRLSGWFGRVRSISVARVLPGGARELGRGLSSGWEH